MAAYGPSVPSSALKALAPLLKDGPARPPRAWLAGCLAVEDAYAVAAWAGAGATGAAQVVVTEADPRKLAGARRGRCGRGLLKELPPGAGRLFVDDGVSLLPCPSLRRSCRFLRASPTAGPPGSSFDLVVCAGAASERMLRRFHGALRPRGLLLLRRGHPTPRLFAALDERLGLYRMRPAAGSRAPARATYESLADIAHDLRGPAGTILGLAAELRRGVPERARREEFLASIARQAKRVARMADRLESAASDAASVDLAEAAGHAVEGALVAARRRGVRLRAAVPPGLTAFIDAADLGHVLANLLDNAVKFSPRGGRVEVTGRGGACEAVLSVRDQGAGIAPSELERVFQRRFRGVRGDAVSGSGLGLSIVRRLVEAAGGRVWARNAPGGGALLQVSLPAMPGRAL